MELKFILMNAKIEVSAWFYYNNSFTKCHFGYIDVFSVYLSK